MSVSVAVLSWENWQKLPNEDKDAISRTKVVIQDSIYFQTMVVANLLGKQNHQYPDAGNGR